MTEAEPSRCTGRGSRCASSLAVMWNTLDLSVFAPFLAEDVRYESSIVMLEGDRTGIYPEVLTPDDTCS